MQIRWKDLILIHNNKTIVAVFDVKTESTSFIEVVDWTTPLLLFDTVYKERI